MVATEYIFARQHKAITNLRDVIEELDPERGAALRNLSYGGQVPNSSKQPDLYVTYITEAILLLHRRLAKLELEARSSARRGGRPKNVA
jgi:hypothetical protein